MPATEQRSVTIRLPENIYQESVKAAKAKNISFNSLTQEGLLKILREQREKDLYDAFTLVGQDAEESDVEYAIHAQAEVMLRDE
jgi:hypothetical protein